MVDIFLHSHTNQRKASPSLIGMGRRAKTVSFPRVSEALVLDKTVPMSITHTPLVFHSFRASSTPPPSSMILSPEL